MTLFSDCLLDKSRTKLVIILVLAVLLRVPGLFLPSLTGDEISTVSQASYDFQDMLVRLAVIDIPGADIAPPLYFIILHVFLKLFSFVPWATRALSLLFDLLAIAAVFGLGRVVFSDRLALLSALFFALSPFQIWYATEIRMYALAALLATLSTLYYLRYSVQATGHNLFCYALFSLLGIYTQYYFALLLIGQMVVAVFFWDRSRTKALIYAYLVMGVLYLPWLAPFLNDLKVLSCNVVPEAVNPLTVPVYLVLKLVFFGNRFFLLAQLWPYLIGAGLLGLLLVLFLKRWRHFGPHVHYLFMILGCGLLLILISSFLSRQVFRPHAAIVFLPLVLVLLAHWIDTLFKPSLSLLIRITFISIWGFVLIAYNFAPLYGKARVKEAVAFLNAINQNQAPVLNPPLQIPCPDTIKPGSFEVIEYYADRQFPVHFLAGEKVSELVTNLQRIVGQSPEFYLINYEDRIPPDFITELKTAIDREFKLVHTTRFESLVETFPLAVHYYRRH
ncbi:glycosyltransferase family 39 protein [bacterium]|nr:glycosyltransferase family 39 protein [bacterium]